MVLFRLTVMRTRPAPPTHAHSIPEDRPRRGERYRPGTRKEKRRILDEIVAVALWHRKHTIRRLNVEGAERERISGTPVYRSAPRRSVDEAPTARTSDVAERPADKRNLVRGLR
jgi:hypothetical protein